MHTELKRAVGLPVENSVAAGCDGTSDRLASLCCVFGCCTGLAFSLVHVHVNAS